MLQTQTRKGSLAQLGEHYLDKVGVAGSSPVGTIKKRDINPFWGFMSLFRLHKGSNVLKASNTIRLFYY